METEMIKVIKVEIKEEPQTDINFGSQAYDGMTSDKAGCRGWRGDAEIGEMKAQSDEYQTYTVRREYFAEEGIGGDDDKGASVESHSQDNLLISNKERIGDCPEDTKSKEASKRSRSEERSLSPGRDNYSTMPEEDLENGWVEDDDDEEKDNDDDDDEEEEEEEMEIRPLKEDAQQTGPLIVGSLIVKQEPLENEDRRSGLWATSQSLLKEYVAVPELVITDSGMTFESSGTDNSSNSGLIEMSLQEDYHKDSYTERYGAVKSSSRSEDGGHSFIVTSIDDLPNRRKTQISKTSDNKCTSSVNAGADVTASVIEYSGYQCFVCHENFEQSDCLSDHMKIHTGEKPNQFSVSDYRLSNTSHLSEHTGTHKGENPYKCLVCSKSFSQSGNLSSHMKTHTGETPYQCTVCSEQFSDHNRLIRHMKIHTGNKPHQCSVCSKRFPTNCHLSRHLRTHTGEKPYQCLVCDKRFSHKSTLTGHIKIHTGEKSYECTVCHKCFSTSSYLSHHKRIHSGVKPYHCSICDKSFSQPTHLTNHIRTHSGEKPYPCSVCEKRFADRSGLSSHMRIHTGQKPYQCAICNRLFSHKNSLSRHMKTHT